MLVQAPTGFNPNRDSFSGSVQPVDAAPPPRPTTPPAYILVVDIQFEFESTCLRYTVPISGLGHKTFTSKNIYLELCSSYLSEF